VDELREELARRGAAPSPGSGRKNPSWRQEAVEIAVSAFGGLQVLVNGDLCDRWCADYTCCTSLPDGRT